MAEIALYLGSLSLGEFLLIWTSSVAILSLYLLLLYQLIRLNKDTKSLKLKINAIKGILIDKLKIECFHDS